MHYYQFNIGDYASHTSHLDELEDLAYRRMIDYCYLNEIGLPESIEEIARVIRMRPHCDRIANVLREFFQQDESGWWKCNRVEKEIALFREKSDKAQKAARKRWENTDANALPTDSERNAKHKPITNNQEPDNTHVTPDDEKPKRKGRQPKQETLIADYIENCKAEGRQAIPEGHPVFDYASRVGISFDFLLLAWKVFRDDMISRGKKQKDWPATFKIYIEKDWVKIWAINREGEYYLTTAGKQAELKYRNNP